MTYLRIWRTWNTYVFRNKPFLLVLEPIWKKLSIDFLATISTIFQEKDVTLFNIMFYVLQLIFWNFIIVSENNLQWNHLPPFSRSRSPKRHWKKQKLRILDEVFRMLFFGVLKRRGFLLWENKKMWSQ